MNYEFEMERLEKLSDSNLSVSIYKNKEEVLKRMSENAGDEKEIEETYQYMKEELVYLEDEEATIYKVDLNNGFPRYFDNAEEAFNYIE